MEVELFKQKPQRNLLRGLGKSIVKYEMSILNVFLYQRRDGDKVFSLPQITSQMPEIIGTELGQIQEVGNNLVLQDEQQKQILEPPMCCQPGHALLGSWNGKWSLYFATKGL